MSKREIKCPHCGQWSEWKEMLQDKCHHCHELLQKEKIDRLAILEAQKKEEIRAEQERLVLQNPILRKITNFAKVIFIGFILFITAIIVLTAG